MVEPAAAVKRWQEKIDQLHSCNSTGIWFIENREQFLDSDRRFGALRRGCRRSGGSGSCRCCRCSSQRGRGGNRMCSRVCMFFTWNTIKWHICSAMTTSFVMCLRLLL